MVIVELSEDEMNLLGTALRTYEAWLDEFSPEPATKEAVDEEYSKSISLRDRLSDYS